LSKAQTRLKMAAFWCTAAHGRWFNVSDVFY